MNTIPAIYENGVFRPLGPVDLPEHARVVVAPEPALTGKDDADAEIDEILSHRYKSGHYDTAERHDEHQP